MARNPARKQSKETANNTPLLAALKFISLAQKDEGQIFETHCILSNKTATAFNGILSAGHLIDDDISVCPHTLKLTAALSKCGENINITQLDNFKLSIKSENFKVVIPCANPIDLNYATPDSPIALIDDNIKTGFDRIGKIVSDTSEHVLTASILLKSNSMLATDRHIIFEYWHGINLPGEFAIPKVAALAVIKSGKVLEKLGYSERTLTFWFTDGCWLKTQLYADTWPDVTRILNLPSKPAEIPLTLFKAVNAIAPFADDNKIHFLNGKIATQTLEGAGATYDIEGLQQGPTLNAKYLQMIEPIATSIDLNVSQTLVHFWGDNLRGALAVMV